jgi:hypothetical protein
MILLNNRIVLNDVIDDGMICEMVHWSHTEIAQVPFGYLHGGNTRGVSCYSIEGLH